MVEKMYLLSTIAIFGIHVETHGFVEELHPELEG